MGGTSKRAQFCLEPLAEFFVARTALVNDNRSRLTRFVKACFVKLNRYIDIHDARMSHAPLDREASLRHAYTLTFVLTEMSAMT